MIVGFFRHGLAVDSGTKGFTEKTRPLTPEGRRKTERAARGVERLKQGFDAVLTSPLVRALETAEILAEVLELRPPQTTERLLPEAAPADLFRYLEEVGARSPVVVGHEPGLSAAVSTLLGTRVPGSLEFKKAGLAVVRVERFAPQPEGSLLFFIPPAVLRALAR